MKYATATSNMIATIPPTASIFRACHPMIARIAERNKPIRAQVLAAIQAKERMTVDGVSDSVILSPEPIQTTSAVEIA